MSGSRPSRRLKTTPFDAAEYLDDEQTIVAYLNEVLAEATRLPSSRRSAPSRVPGAWQSWLAAQASAARAFTRR